MCSREPGCGPAAMIACHDVGHTCNVVLLRRSKIILNPPPPPPEPDPAVEAAAAKGGKAPAGDKGKGAKGKGGKGDAQEDAEASVEEVRRCSTLCAPQCEQ